MPGEAWTALLDEALLVIGEVEPGLVGGDVFCLGEAHEIAVHGTVFAAGPGCDGVAVEGFRAVGDDEVGVEVDGVAEAPGSGGQAP